MSVVARFLDPPEQSQDSSSSEGSSGLIDRIFKLLEKAAATPQGLGLISMLASGFVRASHQPGVPNPNYNPNLVGPAPPSGLTTPTNTYNQWLVPPSNGFDIVLFQIKYETLDQIVNGGGPSGSLANATANTSKLTDWIAAVLGIKHAQAQQQSTLPATIQVTLSDVLFFGGAAMVGGSLAASIVANA